MAYQELIKNFDHIRDYLREFYVYGFKSREQYEKKSARSYDDERRRIESWLGDHIGFRQTPEGKNVFLSIDTRISHHNPLYKAWKAKSFTDGDITLHFILFDILHSPEVKKSVSEICKETDRYLSLFDEPKLLDESTVRKKIREYVSEGLIIPEKSGKTLYYHRADDTQLSCVDALDFFSETAPCGVIGSYLLDKIDAHDEHFAFKHHYISQAMDSDILLQIFDAMHEKKEIVILNLGRHSAEAKTLQLVPIRVLISVQTGRQYLIAYQRSLRRVKSFRLDYILAVKKAETADDFDQWRETLTRMEQHMWGVSTQGQRGHTEKVSFTVHYDRDEEHIYQRLLREKRCGIVEKLDDHTCRFSAEVFDTQEMLPWIRTFICRIIEIDFSNKEIEERFRQDLKDMYRLYGLTGGDLA